MMAGGWEEMGLNALSFFWVISCRWIQLYRFPINKLSRIGLFYSMYRCVSVADTFEILGE